MINILTVEKWRTLESYTTKSVFMIRGGIESVYVLYFRHHWIHATPHNRKLRKHFRVIARIVRGLISIANLYMSAHLHQLSRMSSITHNILQYKL